MIKTYLRLCLIFASIFLLGTVLAAPSAPTALVFNNNATSDYDSGSFFLNWTSGGGDAEANYTVYLFSNNTYYTKAQNASNTGYVFSNTSQANYTFIVEAWNGTGSKVNSSTNISIYVDSTGPSVNIIGYTNSTSKQNSSNLTLNLSVSDALSGLTGSNCLIDVNGTNQSFPVSGGWCNTTSISLSGLNDGNATITVYVNDTVNNIGQNDSFYFVQMDTTAPTASLSESSDAESSITVSYSCADATSGVSSCTLSSSSGTVSGSTISGLNCGTSYTITVAAVDNAENTLSTSSSMSTQNCPGGSGSSSSTPSNPSNSFIWDKITPGKVEIIKSFDKEIGIKEIQINVKNEAQNVEITVTKYEGKPADISVEKSGKVYQYIRIDTKNLNSKLLYANAEFKVSKAWVQANSLSREEISVYKFNEDSDKWIELETFYESEDTSNYYYNVPLSSFSYFAISEKALVAGEEVPSENEAPLGDEETGNFLGEASPSNWWTLAIVIVVIVLVVLYLILNKKKKKRFQKFGY